MFLLNQPNCISMLHFKTKGLYMECLVKLKFSDPKIYFRTKQKVLEYSYHYSNRLLPIVQLQIRKLQTTASVNTKLLELDILYCMVSRSCIQYQRWKCIQVNQNQNFNIQYACPLYFKKTAECRLYLFQPSSRSSGLSLNVLTSQIQIYGQNGQKLGHLRHFTP